MMWASVHELNREYENAFKMSESRGIEGSGPCLGTLASGLGFIYHRDVQDPCRDPNVLLDFLMEVSYNMARRY